MGDISLESFINAQKRSLMAVNFNSNIQQEKLRTVMSSRTLFFIVDSMLSFLDHDIFRVPSRVCADDFSSCVMYISGPALKDPLS